jgi:hypothetical protein
MAQTAIQRAAARSNSAAIQPAPAFELPALPDKIANIDREGAQQWIGEVNAAIANWVSQINAANTVNLNSTTP